MTALYIVRHGETRDNLEGRIQGHTDSPLTPLGIRQAEAIASRLASEKFDAIYSSDLGRAVDTAEAIASCHNLPIQTTDLLREANLGKVQGLTQAEFESSYPDEYRKWRTDSVSNRPPDAESLESVISRCKKFLKMILENYKDDERILAVVHGGSVRGLFCATFGLPPTFFKHIRTANASLSIINIGERPSVELLNDTCHLWEVRVTEEDADNAGALE
ncbi:MAG: histidine phosphatase family protein [Armatimonadota bacterium]|nr:histidine phosphatase family protein [bacterium]